MEFPLSSSERPEIALARKLMDLCDLAGDSIIANSIFESVPRAQRLQAARQVASQLYEQACDMFDVPMKAREDMLHLTVGEHNDARLQDPKLE